MDIDEYDRCILSHLQKNNKLSQKELAQKVNLSISAVNRRIGILEDKGIIVGNVCLLDPRKLKKGLTVIVEILAIDERLHFLEENIEQFMECPNILEAYYVTGEYDFLLILAVEDMEEYQQITKDLFFSSKNIKRFRTIVVMQQLKHTTEIPLTLTK